MIDRPLAHYLPHSRRELLTALREHGEAWIGDLARELHLSVSAVRQTLSIMELDGLVSARQERGSVGRPRLLFSLTGAGAYLASRPDLFHVDLATSLVAAAKEGPLTAERWGEALLARHREHGQFSANGESSTAERLGQVAELWREGGFRADLAEDGGELELRLESCPLAALAAEDGLVCRAEQAYLEQALGCPVEHSTEGEGNKKVCVYRLRVAPGLNGSSGEKGHTGAQR